MSAETAHQAEEQDPMRNGHIEGCPLNESDHSAIKDFAAIRRVAIIFGSLLTTLVLAVIGGLLDVRATEQERGPRLASLEVLMGSVATEVATNSRLDAAQQAALDATREQLRSIEAKLDRLIERGK